MDEWLRDDLEIEGVEPEPEGVEHGLGAASYLEDEEDDDLEDDMLSDEWDDDDEDDEW